MENENTSRRVGFYHRNSSESRKMEILKDLQLPLGSPDKTLLCVVATVSLGKGRVKKIVENSTMGGGQYH